jgi:mono/diheme cytochrome c family protein
VLTQQYYFFFLGINLPLLNLLSLTTYRRIRLLMHMCIKRSRLLIFSMVVISVAYVLTGCIQESSQTGGEVGKDRLPAAISTDSAMQGSGLLVEGATLFSKFCTTCHGIGGSGRGSRSGPSLQRPELIYGRTTSSITQSIRDGRPGGMPSFGHVFSFQQIEALSAYVMSLKK